MLPPCVFWVPQLLTFPPRPAPPLGCLPFPPTSQPDPSRAGLEAELEGHPALEARVRCHKAGHLRAVPSKRKRASELNGLFGGLGRGNAWSVRARGFLGRGVWKNGRIYELQGPV